MRTNNATPMAAPPRWLRCESCGSLDELVLGRGTEAPILCRACRKLRRPGPIVEVHSYVNEDPTIPELEAERSLRSSLGERWEQLARVVVRLADSGVAGGARLCQINATVVDGTQLAAESSAGSLREAVAQSVDRLTRRMAHHIDQRGT